MKRDTRSLDYGSCRTLGERCAIRVGLSTGPKYWGALRLPGCC